MSEKDINAEIIVEQNPRTDSANPYFWGALCHLAGLCGCIIPFGGVVGPLVVWSQKRESHAFVDQQGKEALNFQLSCLAYLLLAGISCLLLVGFVLIPIILVCKFVFTIIAAIQSYGGVHYRYPLVIRFFKSESLR